MKHFVFIAVSLVIAFFAVEASALEVDFKNTKQFTLGWDAVTKDTDGDPITGVTYEVLMVNAVTDINKTNPVVVATTAAILSTITIGVKGRYFVGVRALHDGDRSGINWGDDTLLQTVPPFGVRFAAPPETPANINNQE
jgi:hypothetical protein